MFTGKMNIVVSKAGKPLNVLKNIYNGKVLGSAYLPVTLPDNISVKENCETKLDVKEAYMHCKWDKETKRNVLVLDIVSAEVVSVYEFKHTSDEKAEEATEETKETKKSKKTKTTKKTSVVDDDLPF